MPSLARLINALYMYRMSMIYFAMYAALQLNLVNSKWHGLACSAVKMKK